MKRIIIFNLILAAFFCSINMAKATPQEDGNISVYFSSVKEVSPDVAEITFGVETYNKDLQKASDENKKIADGLYFSLKSLINESRGDYIKTANYYATPIYNYKNGNRFIDKYMVQNSVTVLTKDVNLIARLIDTATSKGVSKINNLDFSVSDYESHCNLMLAELTKKSYKRANDVVKPLNLKVTGIKSMSTSCSAGSNEAIMYAARGSAMKADNSSSTPIEEGKTKINASLNSSFYVK